MRRDPVSLENYWNADLFENADELSRARGIFLALDQPYKVVIDGQKPPDEIAAAVREWVSGVLQVDML